MRVGIVTEMSRPIASKILKGTIGRQEGKIIKPVFLYHKLENMSVVSNRNENGE